VTRTLRCIKRAEVMPQLRATRRNFDGVAISRQLSDPIARSRFGGGVSDERRQHGHCWMLVSNRGSRVHRLAAMTPPAIREPNERQRVERKHHGESEL